MVISDPSIYSKIETRSNYNHGDVPVLWEDIFCKELRDKNQVSRERSQKVR